MAGKVPNLEPHSSGPRMPKTLRQYWSPFFQRWITKQGNTSSGVQSEERRAVQATFTATVQLIKNLSGDDCDAATKLAAFTPFLDRDLKMKVAGGLLYNWIDDDGKTWVGRRQVYPDIQAALDSITVDIGSVLVRTPDGWLGLLPGLAQEVLTIDIASGMPAWLPPAGGGGGGAEFTFPIPETLSVSDAQNFGSRGQIYTCLADIKIASSSVTFNAVATGVYKIGCAPFDIATGKMTVAPIYSPSWTAPASQMESPSFIFAVEPEFVAGQTIILFVVRTDVSGTTSLNMCFTAIGKYGHPGMWIPTNTPAYKLASNNPTTADVWTSGGALYPIQPTYSITP